MLNLNGSKICFTLDLENIFIKNIDFCYIYENIPKKTIFSIYLLIAYSSNPSPIKLIYLQINNKKDKEILSLYRDKEIQFLR